MQRAADPAGRVAALRAPQGGRLSRKEIDDYTAYVARYGARGLAYIKVNETAKGREGLQSPILKFLSDAAVTLFVVQLLVVGLCFTGPVFNTQVGIMFWLATAMLYGCHRTLQIQDWHDQHDADAVQDAQA